MDFTDVESFHSSNNFLFYIGSNFEKTLLLDFTGLKGSRSDEYPAELEDCQPICVVTSYWWCERSQIIDLVKKGVPEHVLDNEKPAIYVHEW